MLDAGIEAFTDFKDRCFKRLRQRVKKTATKQEAIGADDWESLGDTALILTEMDPDTDHYRTLVNDLSGIVGMRFKKR
jgi:hypothetical protein